MRFGGPLEFGMKYILQGSRAAEFQNFSLRYAPFNLRMYFFEPVHWSLVFPFLRHGTQPPVPAGHEAWASSIGIFTALPVSWLALAAMIGIRSGGPGSLWRWFLAILATLFFTSVLTIGLYRCTTERYELDFLPALLLLAAAGTLMLDCVLARRLIRRAFHCAAVSLLLASLAFGVCNNIESHAYRYWAQGDLLWSWNRLPDAEAQYEAALRLNPDFAEAHNSLAILFANQPGRQADAIAHFQTALRLWPDDAEAHNNLANLLARQPGRQAEAIAHYETALRIRPDYANAHYDLAVLLASQPGRQADAIAHYENAVRLNPNSFLVHFNLARELEKLPNRQEEAALHYRAALKINPDSAPAREALQRLQTNAR
jgi:tetratricopeptide (TPR) repeat protein